MKDENRKLSRWYFGGLGSAGAACCTHPLDLLKVSPLLSITYLWEKYCISKTIIFNCFFF